MKQATQKDVEIQSFVLGDRVKDSVSGFTGILISTATHVTRSVVVRIAPEQVIKKGKVAESKCFDSQQVVLVKKLNKGKDFSELSPQEMQVVKRVAQGKTNKEIGNELGLSDRTVRNYLTNVFQKLHVSRRSQLAANFATDGG